MIDLALTFDKYRDEEYLKFHRVQNPPTRRPDLAAFILLDRFVPGDRDIVAWSEHDIYGLNIEVSTLAEVASEEDVITLLRCGVDYDDENEQLTLLS